MDEEELRARLAKADEAIALLSCVLSEQMAVNQACTSVLTGVLASLGNRAGVFDAVHGQLERAQATNLADSTNEVFMSVYDRYSQMFYAALQDAGHAIH